MGRKHFTRVALWLHGPLREEPWSSRDDRAHSRNGHEHPGSVHYLLVVRYQADAVEEEGRGYQGQRKMNE
jgi:hypothetical protein